jgi:hypothetical protein
MGIMVFGGTVMNQVVLLKPFGDGIDRALAGYLDQDIGHLAFEQQPGIKKDVRTQKNGHVAAGGAVYVGVDPGADDTGDSSVVPRHLADDVRHHAYCCADPYGIVAIECRRLD